jgi:hypothetical protein
VRFLHFQSLMRLRLPGALLLLTFGGAAWGAGHPAARTRTEERAKPSASHERSARGSERQSLRGLKKTFSARLEQEKIIQPEAALVRDIVRVASQHPGAGAEEIARRVDASSLLGTVRWMVPELSRALTEAKARSEKNRAGWEEISQFIESTLADARRMSGSTRMTYEEYAKMSLAYLSATRTEGVRPGERFDPAAEIAEGWAKVLDGVPYRAPIFETRPLDIRDLNDVSPEAIAYVGLLRHAQRAGADGVVVDARGFAAHDFLHHRVSVGREREHEPSRFMRDSTRRGVESYLVETLARQDFLHAFRAFQDTVSDETDRRILEVLWFSLAHEDGVPVAQDSFLEALRTTSVVEHTLKRSQVKDDLAPLYERPAEVTTRRFRRVAKAFTKFVESYEAPAAE